MRMGGPPAGKDGKRRRKKKDGGGDGGTTTTTSSSSTLNPNRPKFSSPNMIVGRVSHNVIESILAPILMDMAITSAEAYADEVFAYEQAWSATSLASSLSMSMSMSNDDDDDDDDDDEEQHGGEGGMTTGEEEAELDDDGNARMSTTVSGVSSIDVEPLPLPPLLPPHPPPPPTAYRLFASQREIDEFASMLVETASHFSSPSNAWRAHVNAAKFERTLDERYGRMRPLVKSHPGIEIFVRNVQRKYAMGSFSPFRQGDGPISRSTAIIGLFMMHRQGVRADAMILVAMFCLVGLQPWALVTLVVLGRWEMDRRRWRRVGGMPAGGRMRNCEPYHARRGGGCGGGGVKGADGKKNARGGATTESGEEEEEESEEEERSRKYMILARPVGTRYNAADLSLRDESHDVLLLGSGVETLYAGALLARAGRRVCVLSPTEDVSGCETMSCAPGDGRFAGVPFDARGTDVSHPARQQALLAPALCTSTDVQGGIRFARIGSVRDGYAHSVLSVPGLGAEGGETVPVVINSGGHVELADYCSTRLGDGYPSVDLDGNVDVGGSTSLGYARACLQINVGSGAHYLSKLLGSASDKQSSLKSASDSSGNSYQQASLRTASAFLDKCLPLNPHVRSLMAAIGMPNENLSPDDTSMAAHVSHLCAMLSEEGMVYPVGGPRALCHALASVIEQCDGRVVGGVSIQELLFDRPSEEKSQGAKNGKIRAEKDDGDGDAVSSDVASGPKPRCRGVRLQNGCEVKLPEGGGAVVSMMGFIPTFLHLLPSDVRTLHGVPPGLPAVSERRPLMKILVGLNGTREELDLTGADWYRLPNAALPRDELDPLTGQVKCGTIGSDESGRTQEMVDGVESETMEISAIESRSGGRGKRSKDDASSSSASSSAPSNTTKKIPRSKFTSGSSWMKVSFPSAKDPSWFDRYGSISTCVVTIEADDEFVRMFDTKPRIYSILKPAGDTTLGQRVMKDLCATFPQLEGKIECFQISGPHRSGLTQNPARFAIKGNRPEMAYPGLFIGGADLTVADSTSGAIFGGWMAANAIMGYSSIDHLYLNKNITTDLQRFLDDPSMATERDGVIVEDLAVPFKKKGSEDDGLTNPAESTKEE